MNRLRYITRERGGGVRGVHRTYFQLVFFFWGGVVTIVFLGRVEGGQLLLLGYRNEERKRRGGGVLCINYFTFLHIYIKSAR